MNVAGKNVIAKHLDSLDAAVSDLRDLIELAQNAFDEKSERWQESEKGEEAQEEISMMENALCELESAHSSLEELSQS